MKIRAHNTLVTLPMAVALESEAGVEANESLSEIVFVRQQAIRVLPQVISEQGIEASGNKKFEGAVFGRDAAYFGILALEKPENWDIPNLLPAIRRTLLLTSEFQGKKFDSRSGEAPFEMPHEIQGPESNQERLANLLEKGWPVKEVGGHLEMVNWKSLDATCLWIILFVKYVNVTKDLDFRDKLWENFEGALSWINLYGDKDKDFLIEGGPEYEGDMQNQFWTDSDDSLDSENGEKPRQPIVPLDANCFAYWAEIEAGKLCEQKGQYEKAQKLRERAAKRKEIINTLYWMPEEDTFAPALDGNKKQIKVVRSDAAIALWSGAVDEDHARRMAQRLLEPDLMTPFGLRSRSSLSRQYDPTKYQRGNVWLQLAPLAAAGCEKYGLDLEAHAFDRVLPNIAKLQFEELTQVDEKGYPSPYLEDGKPAACYPMAWVIGGVLNRTAPFTTSFDKLKLVV